VPVEKRLYPHRDAVFTVDEWFRAHPEQECLQRKLTVSGISSSLMAEKRGELAEKLTSIADVHVDTELRIGREASTHGKGAK
jgi:hypothetical protein